MARFYSHCRPLCWLLTTWVCLILSLSVRQDAGKSNGTENTQICNDNLCENTACRSRGAKQQKVSQQSQAAAHNVCNHVSSLFASFFVLSLSVTLGKLELSNTSLFFRCPGRFDRLLLLRWFVRLTVVNRLSVVRNLRGVGRLAKGNKLRYGIQSRWI